MSRSINITDLDFSYPEEITVRHTGTLPDFYMRNVIDLASIVGNHNVSPHAHIWEYEPVDYLIPGVPLFV